MSPRAATPTSKLVLCTLSLRIPCQGKSGWIFPKLKGCSYWMERCPKPKPIERILSPSGNWNWTCYKIPTCIMIIFVGLAYQGKDIVFGFVIGYSSLMDFGPLGNYNRSNFFFIWGFLKDDIVGFVLKLEISYRVITSWKILVFFLRGFFEDYIFLHGDEIFEFP
jgi:hypothetical protein